MSSIAYSGAGVEAMLGRSFEVCDFALDSEDEPELEEDCDFFRRSPGLTMAISEGLDEFSIITRASMGSRTFV